MLNRYSRPFRTLTGLLLFTFLSCCILIPTGCNKSSNQLKPFSDNVKFSKTIDYNGSTLLLVDIEQKMYVGADTLKITITNPTGNMIDSSEVFLYVQKADEFDQTLNYQYTITLKNLAPQKDTTIVLNNNDLPFDESEIKLGLLFKDPISSNPLHGIYNGQVSYLYGNDSVPNTFSFCKGVVYADGKFDFWMKLGSTNKKLSGQFIDTLSMNSIYQASAELTSMNCMLDTLPNGTKFESTTNLLRFRVKLQGQPANSENKLWFNLNK